MDFQFWKDDVQSANFSVKSSNLAVDLLNSRPRPNSRTANSRPRQNLDIPGPGQILPPVVYCKYLRLVYRVGQITLPILFS